MTLLQVCNVGRIVGGTAACAWSIARALPEIEHHVAFLSPIQDETQAAFQRASLHRCERITEAFVRDLGCDLVILHNTPSVRAERITSAWVLQYVHSRGTRAAADCTRYCSRWLADRCLGRRAGDHDVLYQGVPRPIGAERAPAEDRSLVVGRICTPTAAKWPASLSGLYAELAEAHPQVRWEFVGCSEALRPVLTAACRRRAVFHSAGWSARSHLARWDVLLYHHPSLSESFGRTVAEAMRAGCIPIVDAQGGFCEQIQSGTGWLCRRRHDFSEALEQLADPVRRVQMAKAARRVGDERFSLASLRERLVNLWSGAAPAAARS